MATPVRDVCSLSNPHESLCVELDLRLRVDFEQSTLSGGATWTVDRTSPGAPLLLDTKGLTINLVRDASTGAALTHELLPTHTVYGRALRIDLPAGNARPIVAIEYSTSAGSEACQWLPKEQTAGKRHPYLFTQCQAIHGRALLPCQDSPGAKFTYTATITAPSWATALMGALPSAKRPRDADANADADGERTFAFAQPMKIPAYLLALAVGDLASRDAGPRSKVRNSRRSIPLRRALMSA